MKRTIMLVAAIVFTVCALGFTIYEVGWQEGYSDARAGYAKGFRDGLGRYKAAFEAEDVSDPNLDWGTKAELEDVDVKGITGDSTAESWTWTWGGVRGNFIEDKFVPLNEEEAAIAKRLWLNDYGEEWRRKGYYVERTER